MEGEDLPVVGGDFHHEPVGRQDLVAGAALLPVAWLSKRLRRAFARQAAISHPHPDENADRLQVHNGSRAFPVTLPPTSAFDVKPGVGIGH